MTTYKIWLNNATATTHCADEVIENKIDKLLFSILPEK
jgi:hypothetical protein